MLDSSVLSKSKTWVNQYFITSLFLFPHSDLVFVSWLQLIENSVCLLRNLSYQVHREIPGCERFQEALPLNQGPAPSGQKGGCFSSRKSKGLCRVTSVGFVCSSGGRRVGPHERQRLAIPTLARAQAHSNMHKQNASLSEECQQFSPSSEMAHPLHWWSLFVFHSEYWSAILKYNLCL